MRLNRPVPLFILLLTLLLGWAPWITDTYAAVRAANAFEAAWAGVIDGCGFACNGCGPRPSERTIGGQIVELEYACGLLPFDSPEFHQFDRVYVSFLGTVHDLPRP